MYRIILLIWEDSMYRVRSFATTLSQTLYFIVLSAESRAYVLKRETVYHKLKGYRRAGPAKVSPPK